MGEKCNSRVVLDLEPYWEVGLEGVQDVHCWPRVGKCRLNTEAWGFLYPMCLGFRLVPGGIFLGAEGTC